MLTLLALFTVARLAFLVSFGPVGSFRDSLTWKALLLGLRMDARLAALCVFPALVLLREGGESEPRWKAATAPFSLVLNLLICSGLIVIASFDDQRAKPWAFAFIFTATAEWCLFRKQGVGLLSIRRLWKAFTLVMTTVLALAYAADAGCYTYIHERLNGGVLQFLGNPLISLQMIWETYPVLRILLALAFALAATAWVLERAWHRLGLPARSPDRPMRIFQGAVATAGLLILIWGRFNGYPLRWGDAYSLGQGFQTQLALNPVLFLLETLEDPSEGYSLADVRASGPRLAEYFGCTYVDGANGPRLDRVQEPRPLLPAGMRPNLIFIHLESFAAAKTGTFGNPLDPTPRFDALAKEGLLFDHCYSPAENTSRALFALLFGLADMSPGGRNSATRNPLLADQRTLVNDLDGYSKHYFVAGTGDWAQIRAVLKHNIHGLQVKEKGDFKSRSVDVWGASDVDFLHECSGFLDSEDQPFFALVQMAGNHPPFTIPNRSGFSQSHPPTSALIDAGFVGDKEFNSLRLLDWSLGQFIDEVRTRPWFANTLFILYGDHGVSRGKYDPRYGEMALISHHVPFLIFAPGLIKPGRVSTTTSLMDALPTVMSLLGRRVTLHTLGKDALNPRYNDIGTAFVFDPFVTPSSYGLLNGDQYVVVRPGTDPALYDLNDSSGANLASLHPADAHRLADLAKAMRVWSNYLVSHNHP
ncbi:MAG: LTA synthase family protein [Acidobacteria bacterium]|nr:LTA synthase family protein [Acidobacteriota bacterium]